MSQPTNTEALPLYLRRKIAGDCTRCGAPAGEDSQLCDACAPKVRGYRNASAKRRREKLRKARKCRDCQRRATGLRCTTCRKRDRAAKLDRRRVDHGADRVDHDSAGAWKTDHSGRGGSAVERYAGRARRGRPTEADRTADLVRDFDFFLREVGKAKHAVMRAIEPDIDELPAAQRGEVWRQVRALAQYADRFRDAIDDEIQKRIRKAERGG